MSSVETRNEYADVDDMFRRLQDLVDGSDGFFRQREEIIERMLPVAKHVARRFRGRGEEYDDLFQAASVGLVNAVNRFDPDKGTEFLPFAVPTIMGEVRRHFRDRGWALKVPRRLKELQGQLIQARAELSQRSGRAPTPSELAVHLGIDRETVVDALIAGSNYSTLSTDAPAGGDGDGATLSSSLGCLDAGLAKVVDVETVRPLIEALPEREQTVLMMRFFGDKTQTQIAQHLGISQMHVSRLLNRTLAMLRSQAGPEADSRPVRPAVAHPARRAPRAMARPPKTVGAAALAS